MYVLSYVSCCRASVTVALKMMWNGRLRRPCPPVAVRSLIVERSSTALS